jgi:inorganic pyrophosphatase
MKLNIQSEQFPNVFYGIIEIPKESNVKCELNEGFNMIEFDRELSNSMIYPGNYGFIPSTLAEDGDPVDIVMIDSDPHIEAGTLVKLKPLGILKMMDCGFIDNKILTTTSKDKSINDITDVYEKFLDKTKDFFANYKNLDNQKVVIGGWKGREEALGYLKDKIKPKTKFLK